MDFKVSTFSNIRFKKPIAKRFQTFSRMYYKTHTLALAGMLDFFKYNEISPHDRLGQRMGLILDYLKHLKEFLNKRNNATISIIKDLEKHGVLPTKAMMQLLFEGMPPKEKQPELLLEEITDVEHEDDFFGSMQAIKLREEKNILKRDLEEMGQRFEDVLYGRIEIISPSFGKERLKLHMTVEEYKKLKEQFKNNP